MRKIASFLILFCFLACTNENSNVEFTITIQAEGMNGAGLHLKKYGKILDSVIVDDGVFTLKATLPDLELCTVFIDGVFSKPMPVGRSKSRGWAGHQSFVVEKGATYVWTVNKEERKRKKATFMLCR